MPAQPPQKPPKPIQALQQRRARLLQKIAALGPVLQGTITERIIVRESPDGDGKKREYGPYYQWTWKREGKTVTVNLSASQAKIYQQAIEEHRKMEGLLDQLRAASLQLLEATTQGVSKRERAQGGRGGEKAEKA